jgi:gluconokinase
MTARATAVVGLDLGTTSVKAAAYDGAGVILDSAEREYPLDSPAPGRAEQDPDVLVAEAASALGEVASALARRGVDIAAVSLSSVMHSLLAVDASGTPLTPVVTYADNRAAAEAEELRRDGGLEVYLRTGTPIHPMSPLLKLRWFQRHRRDVWDAAVRWISIKEHLLQRWTGSNVLDHSVASATGLFAAATLDWDPEALALAGVAAEQLGTLVPSTTVVDAGFTPEWSARIGVPRDTRVVVGASDGVLANLGVGAIAPGIVACSVGTSGAVRAVVDRPTFDPEGRLFCYALTPDHWVVGGATNSAGMLLRWVRDQLFPGVAEEAREAGQDPYDALVDLGASVGPGAEGLVFLPYLTGERAPHWSSLPQGVLFGLQRSHGRAHVIRAALEGVMYQLNSVLRLLEASGVHVEEVRASGGFTVSTTWVQIMADVFDRPISLPLRSEGSAFGAALLGMHALGWLGSLDEVDQFVEVGAHHDPDPAAARVHDRLQGIFERLHDALVPEYRALAEFRDEFTTTGGRERATRTEVKE